MVICLMNEVLATYPLYGKRFKDCRLNVYVYHAALVGIVEHNQYRSICEMSAFSFTAQDYISWRHQIQEHPSALISREGRTLHSAELRRLLFQTAEETGWPVYSSPVEAISFT